MNRDTQDRMPSVVMVAGVPFSDFVVMDSKYPGFCMHSGRPVRIGDKIIYKSNSNFTDDEYVRLFPPENPRFKNGCSKPLVALYDEVIDIKPVPMMPVGRVEGDIVRKRPLGMPHHPPSEHQVRILELLRNYPKRHMLIKALAGCGKTDTLTRVAWTLKLKDLMKGKEVVYLAYNKRLQLEVDPKMFGTGVRCQTTHAFLLRVLGLTPENIEKEGENLDRDRFLRVLCRRSELAFNETNVRKVKSENPLYKLFPLVEELVAFIKHWAITPTYTKDAWIFGHDEREEIDKLITKYKILVDAKDRDTLVGLACSTVALALPAPGHKPVRITFEDMLYVPVVLKMSMPFLNMVLADEVQDFNKCQIILMRMLADAGAKLICVGDPNQCVISGTKILQGSNEMVKAENIQPNHILTSGSGAGRIVRNSGVDQVISRHVEDLEVVTITTKGGKSLTTTLNHTHFAGYLPGEGESKRYYVYLMQRKDIGYRIGCTQEMRSANKPGLAGYQVRSNQEQADALWLLGAYETRSEALYWEQHYSFKYSIPTWTFPKSSGHDDRFGNILFSEFNTEEAADRLLSDLGMFFKHPHHQPKCMSTSRRRNFSITLCGDARTDATMHRYSISGSSPEDATTLKEMGLNVRPAKYNQEHWKVESSHANMEDIHAILERIQRKMDVNVIQKARLGNVSLPLTPASHVLPGMTVFVQEGDKIVEDTVVSATRSRYTGSVHDFNIPKYHNFVANGIVTHNCIYGFRGATGKGFELIHETLSETRHKCDIAYLPLNYRSARAIIRNAQSSVPELQGFKDVEGEVRSDVTCASMLEYFATQDTRSVCTLSRTNDPLFKMALATITHFIRENVRNKKVCILGKKGVGAPLIKLIKRVSTDADGKVITTAIADKLGPEDEVLVPGMIRLLNAHVAQMYEQWGKEDTYKTVLEKLSSNAECIATVCEMVDDDKIETVIKLINDLVTDKPEPNSIIFATIHAAKMMEWDTVFVIKPDLFPFPTVQMYDEEGNITEEGQEELNIIYVRDTRPITNLYYTCDWIEKDRMGGVMDVRSYITSPQGGDSEDDWTGYFESKDEGEDVPLAPIPVGMERAFVPSGQRMIEDARNGVPFTPGGSGGSGGAEPVPNTLQTVPKRAPAPRVQAPKVVPRVVVAQPRNNGGKDFKWVDNGEPF